MVGDVGVERACSGGSAAGWSSPGFKRGGGGVLRCGSEERARERGEWVSGVPLLLGRSLEESGGLCRGRSTATSRWRPSGRFWARGTGGKGPARSQGAMEEALGRRVGDSATEKRRPGSLSTAPASVPSVGGGAEQSREVEMEIRVDL